MFISSNAGFGGIVPSSGRCIYKMMSDSKWIAYLPIICNSMTGAFIWINCLWLLFVLAQWKLRSLHHQSANIRFGLAVPSWRHYPLSNKCGSRNKSTMSRGHQLFIVNVSRVLILLLTRLILQLFDLEPSGKAMAVDAT